MPDPIARAGGGAGEPTLAALVAERFGADIVGADGRLDRPTLADHAFVTHEDRRGARGDHASGDRHESSCARRHRTRGCGRGARCPAAGRVDDAAATTRRVIDGRGAARGSAGAVRPAGVPRDALRRDRACRPATRNAGRSHRAWLETTAAIWPPSQRRSTPSGRSSRRPRREDGREVNRLRSALGADLMRRRGRLRSGA